jgi:hypothetical protein
MMMALFPAVANAQTPTVTRSFSATSVAAGGELEVTVTHSGDGRFGQLVETLPEGFSLVSSSPGSDDVDISEVDGQVVITFLAGKTLEYRVTELEYTVTAAAGSEAGSFSGVLKDEDKVEHDVGGQHQVTVAAAADLLTRYDVDDRDGSIGKSEYLRALGDYLFSGTLSKAEYLEVLSLYLFG